MKYSSPRFAAIALIGRLSFSAHAAETGHNKSSFDNADVSADALAAASERIRQSGALIREDLQEARVRLAAQKAQKEAGCKRVAGWAHQQVMKDAAEQGA